MKSYSEKHGNLMHHTEIDHLMRELHAARQCCDLDAGCRSFSKDASFQIETAGRAKRVAIEAVAIGEIRSLLALLIKTFSHVTDVDKTRDAAMG